MKTTDKEISPRELTAAEMQQAGGGRSKATPTRSTPKLMLACATGAH